MENLPEVKEDWVKEHTTMLSKLFDDGLIMSWMNERISWLSENNPSLYDFMVKRSKVFAEGIIRSENIPTIIMTNTLETIFLLTLIGKACGGQKENEAFYKMMKEIGADNIDLQLGEDETK